MIKDFLRQKITDAAITRISGYHQSDKRYEKDSSLYQAYLDGVSEAVVVDRPKDKTQGDYATAAALALKDAHWNENPKALAEDIVTTLKGDEEFMGKVSEIKVAGPGFINITLNTAAVADALDETGHAVDKQFVFYNKRINIEFISVNPTGKLHAGHGRSAFYGDILARILRHAGADVVREFYINDSRDSNQIRELGKTALGKGTQYLTPALEGMLREINFSGMDEQEAGFRLAEEIQEHNRSFIEERLGIVFDKWYSEDKHIRETGAADAILEKLGKFTYKKDGAVWLKTTEFGDDEDRVVVRSDGTKSYFLNDIAYHADKFDRGYHEVIDIWGADHHGHVKRILAVKKMLKWVGDFHVFIAQMVGIKDGEERKKMSKRLGNVILLEDLVNEYGIDVVRWFFADKAVGTHMDFDADLAREHSAKNPVFYVQYAHARIASIVENAKDLATDNSTLEGILKDPQARALAMKVLEFPETVEAITHDYQVHKMTTYAYELASQFSQFYRDVRIIDIGTYRGGALELARITKAVLAKSLDLLGISAPNKM